MRRQHGVTLLELMVVLVIGGLLMSIAVPSYRPIVGPMPVTQAITDITRLGAQIERWRTNTFDYPATLAAANLDGLVDPWGNAYRYLKISTATIGNVRRDRNLRPINSDFDLYSVGRDGRTTTQLQGRNGLDDVVRANNGGYVGLAEDY